VDAEYDDTFMVKKNYFSDLKYGITASMRLNMTEDQYKDYMKAVKDGKNPDINDFFVNNPPGTEVDTDKDVIIEEKKSSEIPSKTQELLLSSSSMLTQGTNAISAVDNSERPELPSVPEQPDLKASSPSEFLTYEVTKTDALAKAHADAIWEVLEGIDPK
jgi:hypothetical protein